MSDPAKRQVTLDNLGAWLVKGNADHSDLLERVQREPRIEKWCVRPGYRARLMRAGQPVVLWAAGTRQRITYGVWGCGVLSGPAEPDPDGTTWRVPLTLTVGEPGRWVARERLRADPGFGDAEVFRQPQAANPSFLTVEQFRALRVQLDAAGPR